MNPTRRSLLTAAVPGSLLLILLYVILERCGVASAFRIAFVAGAGAFLLVFALLFLRGLRTASAFDRWESEKPAFLYRAPSSLFAAGEKPGEGKLYLFPGRLVFVRFRRGEARETVFLQEEIEEMPEPGEELELLLSGGRAVSLTVPDKKEALDAIRKAFGGAEDRA